MIFLQKVQNVLHSHFSLTLPQNKKAPKHRFAKTKIDKILQVCYNAQKKKMWCMNEREDF